MRKQCFFALCTLAGLVSPARAQFIGYVSPQTVQQTLTSSGNAVVPQACSGTPQLFPINNLGQTQHYLNISTSTNPNQPTQFQAEIDGIDAHGTTYRLSDVMENAITAINSQGQGSVYGSGTFSRLQAKVTCFPNTATYTAIYSGGWGTSNVNAGSYLAAQIDKVSFNGASGSVGQSDTFQTPFGSTAGTIYFQYFGAAAGGSLSVICVTNQFVYTLTTLTLANVNTLQQFSVTDAACPYITLSYAQSGATTITAEYVFLVPGRAANSTASIGSVTQGTSPWVVSGTVNTTPSLSSTIISGQQAVTNSDVALATNTLAHGICVAALSTNAASVFIGTTGVTTSTGLELPAKASTCLSVSNSNAVHVIAAAGGSSVSWVGN